MTRATFSFEGISIGVTVEDQGDIEWLTEFLVPWFDLSDSTPDVEVSVRQDRAMFEKLIACPPAQKRVNAFMMDTRVIDFPCWNIPGQQLACLDEQNQIFYLITDEQIHLVYSARPNNLRTSLMRVLREVAMGAAQLRGGRFLHASAFAINGRAVIVTGPRGAGKTSLLSYVLSNSKATFLTNDRLLVKRRGQQVQLRGMPTIVSIRSGTMKLFPKMRPSIEDQGFTTKVTMMEARQSETTTSLPTRDGRWGLTPRQFCSILDCKPQREARAAILLFPRQTGLPGSIELRKTDTFETRDQLQHSLFGHIGPDSLSDAFTIVPPGLKKRPADDDKTLFTALVNSMTAFDCELGNDAYRGGSGIEKLLQILENPGQAVQRAAVNPAIAR